MSVKKASVRDQVRRTLTERILAGHYKPGERLIELQVARELGTSQGSVREALRELEATHLVETTPHRGTRVRIVGVPEIREAYSARGLLEQAAAGTAAAAFVSGVEELRAEVACILRAADAKDYADQAAHVYTLHRMIVAASGNATLLRLWESLAFETWVRIRLGWGEINRKLAETSYARILATLERGDGAAAGQLLREHAEAFAPPAESAVTTTSA
ncbi:GntR family transcriptional regulator [Gemmata sp. G18]|uniref:GntR family transcriptional regulator n=1 Tax=Gemmata palustris TaxID=2822762 RepID=A0ABS5BLU7_9BACT|nr:GntR family transcriptional regulator [Gemmata palustris]MBP3954682.1 GntR family transcriptional regulator [Gemmata palustris]